jgi:hypothetical protein
VKGEGKASHQIRWVMAAYQQTASGRAFVCVIENCLNIASKTKHVRHWRTGEQSQLESDRRARKARAVDYLDIARYVDAMMR